MSGTHTAAGPNPRRSRAARAHTGRPAAGSAGAGRLRGSRRPSAPRRGRPAAAGARGPFPRKGTGGRRGKGHIQEPEPSLAGTRRDPSLLVAQKSLLAPQHLPQLRQTPPPQVLGSWGLEAAGQRGHSAGAAAGGAAGTRLPRQPPRPAPARRPAATLGHSRASPFSRKDWFYSNRIELY